jgi:hypothetical protein
VYGKYVRKEQIKETMTEGHAYMKYACIEKAFSHTKMQSCSLCGECFPVYYLILFCVLTLRNSTCRACSSAGTAIDTFVGIDLKFAVSHADRTYRALCLASAASYTSITNYISHNLHPPFIYKSF